MEEHRETSGRPTSCSQDDGGIMDYSVGSDYSKCPDVYLYLQILAQTLGQMGTADELAEIGRDFMGRRLAEGTGLFVPHQRIVQDGMVEDGTLAPEVVAEYTTSRGPFSPYSDETTWADLLSKHQDDIEDAARTRMEEDFPDLATQNGQRQHRRVKKGMGWENLFVPLNRVTIGKRLILTNIRAPIPRLESPIPPAGSPAYAHLIAALYHRMCHPVSLALQADDYDEDGVLSLRYCQLRQRGVSAELLPYSQPRFNAPWARWNEQAEIRYAQRGPLYASWEREREQSAEAGTVKLTAFEARMLAAKKEGARWCAHDEPEGHCWVCNCGGYRGEEKVAKKKKSDNKELDRRWEEMMRAKPKPVTTSVDDIWRALEENMGSYVETGNATLIQGVRGTKRKETWCKKDEDEDGKSTTVEQSDSP